MKEIENINQKDEVKAVAEIPAETQEIYQGRQKLHAGHKCWRIDGKTFEVQEATYTIEAVKFEEAAVSMTAPKRKVLMEEGCWYVVALNPKNALRKLDGMIKKMQATAEEFGHVI